MKTPHKHAELIKAWADGAEIQFLDIYNEWKPAGEHPQWFEHNVFRIKPEPKPDVVYYGVFDELDGQHEIGSCFSIFQDADIDQLKVVFDGETGKIKSVEVL